MPPARSGIGMVHGHRGSPPTEHLAFGHGRPWEPTFLPPYCNRFSHWHIYQRDQLWRPGAVQQAPHVWRGGVHLNLQLLPFRIESPPSTCRAGREACDGVARVGATETLSVSHVRRHPHLCDLRPVRWALRRNDLYEANILLHPEQSQDAFQWAATVHFTDPGPPEGNEGGGGRSRVTAPCSADWTRCGQKSLEIDIKSLCMTCGGRQDAPGAAAPQVRLVSHAGLATHLNRPGASPGSLLLHVSGSNSCSPPTGAPCPGDQLETRTAWKESVSCVSSAASGSSTPHDQ